ncbi:hypothetical protein [Bradyrhizobium sp.]|uniref:hypothetical protein n=1 Tax=Bradyrhizobium sp. TaxID=376 RepID=UPI001ED46D1C|nr:hypothetical protein [Bradyrhizobium sp.]MBV8919241.1 hypothetical protein [Bradyrhizobium sp.]MBV9978932.1 hypothetical protein [Bradyrhizobium sp.]
MSRLMAEAGALMVHVAGALPNAPIAIVSWLVAEFCAGCAAYALAMYPTFPLEDHDIERRDGDGVVPFRAPDKPGQARSQTEPAPPSEPARAGRARWSDSCAAPSSKAGATSICRGDAGAAVRRESRWE